MKQDIIVYKSGEFVDFNGAVHKIIACGRSYTMDASVITYDNDGIENGGADVARSLAIGIAVQNTNDEFNEEIGKKIALSKTYTLENDLHATTPGLVNTTVVDAVLQQEIDFLRQNPDRVMKGYSKAHKKFLEAKQLEEERKLLSEDENQMITLLKKGVDVEKCKKFAK